MLCYKDLDIKKNFISDIALCLKETMKNNYSSLVTSKNQIIEVLIKEKNLFHQTLEKGLILFKHAINNKKNAGELAFKLWDSYGFPIE